jgi:hypothetical protein
LLVLSAYLYGQANSAKAKVRHAQQSADLALEEIAERLKQAEKDRDKAAEDHAKALQEKAAAERATA